MNVDAEVLAAQQRLHRQIGQRARRINEELARMFHVARARLIVMGWRA